MNDWIDLISLYAHGNEDWVVFEHAERQLTIRELWERVLVACGTLANDDRPVAICTQDPLLHGVALFGALAAGRVAVPIDHRLPHEVVQDVMDRSDASVLVGRVDNNLESLDAKSLLSGPAREPVKVAPTETGTILMTSGSSGAPKLVLRSRGADFHASMSLVTTGFPAARGDRHWLIVPYAAAPWHTLVMGNLMARATVVFAPFEPKRVGDFLEESQITSAYMVPTMLRLAGKHGRLQGAGWDGLRGLLVGGEKLDESFSEYLLGQFGDRLHQSYGMTESPRLAHATGKDLKERPGTVGQIAPLRAVRVIEPKSGKVLAPNEVGELEVNGPDLFDGYLGERPHDGWHRTGDLAYLDEDGYLYVAGRASSVVKVGGNRVSTDEMSAKIAEHPLVRSAAVVAIDDEMWTNRLVAYLEMHDATAVDCRAIEDWLRERVPAFKVPRNFCVIHEIPKDQSGKVALQLLTRMAREATADVD